MHTDIDLATGVVTYTFGNQQITQPTVTGESTPGVLLLSSRLADFYTFEVNKCEIPSNLFTAQLTNTGCYLHTSVIFDPLLLCEYQNMLLDYGIKIRQVYYNYSAGISGYLNDELIMSMRAPTQKVEIDLLKSSNDSLGVIITTSCGAVYQNLLDGEAATARELFKTYNIGMKASFLVKSTAVDVLPSKFLDCFYSSPNKDGLLLEFPYLILCPAIFVAMSRVFQEKRLLIKASIDDYASACRRRKEKLKMFRSRVRKILKKRKKQKPLD